LNARFLSKFKTLNAILVFAVLVVPCFVRVTVNSREQLLRNGLVSKTLNLERRSLYTYA